MIKRYWVWDLETLSNIFTATFIDRDSDEVRTFVYNERVNQMKELILFLDTEVEGLIGYNSIFFDAQVIDYIYKNIDCNYKDICRFASDLINSEKPFIIPEWKLKHRHLDLFKALSLSTSAKRTSLKWCEFMLDLDNIEDMPSQGDGSTWEEQVLAYNLNDVIATKKLYQKYYYEIDLRKKLTQRENINLLNCTEPDLAKKLFSKYLSQEMDISEKELRELKTEREVVHVKDIIFPYVKFKTEKFNNVLKEFNKLSLYENDKFEFIINRNIDITYALGGLHASVNNLIVESNENYIIKSLDFVSWYPNLAIKNGICAEHLPKEIFLKLYEGFFIERKSIPKSDPRNYILKILLNAAYGLSNDKYSFLRDRKVTLAICINGQLLLSMLFEDLLESIPDSKLIMVNTDGCELYIPREYEGLYNEICQKYQDLFKIELEFVDYQKMIISDVNNYIAVDVKGKSKTKGKYEYKNIPLHKNKSHSIIPLSIHEYFVNNIPVEQTIRNHTNIFDFCAGVRAKKSDKKGYSHFELHSLKDSQIHKQKLSKTVRYFISNKGATLIKVYETKDWEQVEAPIKKGVKTLKHWKVTYFNKAHYPIDFKDYNIDYTYYTFKAKEIIDQIEIKEQLKLF
jgi:hypothetical protein